MGKVQEILTQMNIAAANKAAELASERLKEIGEQAVDAFYDNYSPNYYNRSYGLYEAVKPSVNKISAPGVAEGIVTTSSATMGDHYHQGADTVFQWDLVGGEHGGANKVPSPVMSPSPINLINVEVKTKRAAIQAQCIEEAMGIVKAQYASKLRAAIMQEVKI